MISVFTTQLFLSIQSGTMFDDGLIIFKVGTSSTQLSYYYAELISFFALGILGGLLGALFTIGNIKVRKSSTLFL